MYIEVTVGWGVVSVVESELAPDADFVGPSASAGAARQVSAIANVAGVKIASQRPLRMCMATSSHLRAQNATRQLQSIVTMATETVKPPVLMATELETVLETVLVVDFGAQYAQLIARRVREARVYSEIVPHRITAAEVRARKPAGIILSGGPASVHVAGAPTLDPQIFELGIPILGICYGCQLIAQQLGGTVARGGRGEYGRTKLSRLSTSKSTLLPKDADDGVNVWMSHFDAVSVLPTGFSATAATPDSPMAVIENPSSKIWGVQYHPEVVHTELGQSVLENFLYRCAGAKPTWTMSSIVEDQVAAVRALVGGERVICGLSGGVDSAVAAALVHKAIGKQLTCVYVDTGLMRKNESAQVVETFQRNMGIELIHVDAGARFFERLQGITEPEAKRKAIGELFVRIFEENTGGLTDAKFLVLTPSNKAADVLCKKLQSLQAVRRLGRPTDPELEENGVYVNSLDMKSLRNLTVIASTIHRLPYFQIIDEEG